MIVSPVAMPWSREKRRSVPRRRPAMRVGAPGRSLSGRRMGAVDGDLDGLYGAHALGQRGRCETRSPALRPLMRPAWIVVAWVLALGSASALRADDEEPPADAGKTFEEWVRCLDDSDGETRLEAAGALPRFGARSVPPLRRALEHPDAATRAAVARALGGMGEAARPAVPLLIAALGDSNDAAAEAAAFALAALGRSIDAVAPGLVEALGGAEQASLFAAVALCRMGAEAVPALGQALQRGGGEMRKRVLRVVCDMGRDARAILPILVTLEHDPDPEIQDLVAMARAYMDVDMSSAVDAMIGNLRDGAPDERAEAAKKLSMLRPILKQVPPALIAALQDENRDVRRTVIASLANLGRVAEPALPLLGKALSDESADEETVQVLETCLITLGGHTPRAAAVVVLLLAQAATIRERATAVLLGIGRPAAPVLAASLAGQTVAVQKVMLEILGRTASGAEVAVAPLVALLDHPDLDLASRAAAALGKIGAAAVPDLLKALARPDGALRMRAAEALAAVGPAAAEAVPALVQLLGDRDPAMRAKAAEALAGIGQPAQAAAKALRACLGDDDAAVRRASARALGHVVEDDKRAVTALAKAVTDEDEGVRNNAVEALARIGGPAKGALTLLIKALFKVGDPRLRRRIVRALGCIGPQTNAVVPALMRSLRDTDVWVRQTAAEALGKMGKAAKKATGALTKLLDDPDPAVRAAAERALGEIRAE